MNELTLFEIVGCIVIVMFVPALLFKWFMKNTKYEGEAHILLFVVDIFFSCTLYFGMVFWNQSQPNTNIIWVSLAFVAIMYYKTRKFYLRRYN